MDNCLIILSRTERGAVMPWCPEEMSESDEWAFLINFEDDREVVVIESLLSSYGIPMLKKYRGIGGYFKILTGMTAFGVDLYVPESQLELAREILAPTDEE